MNSNIKEREKSKTRSFAKGIMLWWGCCLKMSCKITLSQFFSACKQQHLSVPRRSLTSLGAHWNIVLNSGVHMYSTESHCREIISWVGNRLFPRRVTGNNWTYNLLILSEKTRRWLDCRTFTLLHRKTIQY